MDRFEDTVNLFGVESGTSSGMCVKCDFCGLMHLEDNMDEETGDMIDTSVEFVHTTQFAGLEVCECCFGKIENAVLGRIPDILTWYKRLLDARSDYIERNSKLLNDIAIAIYYHK